NNKLEKTKDENQIYKMWDRKKDKLKLEDTWESELFNIINEGLPHNIFLLKDNIRNEFMQKKDLRNVCVHNKTRKITYSSVEDLWDFIAYAKEMVVVNGSIEVIMEELQNIIEFAEENHYKYKISNLHDSYSKLSKLDKEKYYKWFSDKLYLSILQADFSELKVYDDLLEIIFKSPNTIEYEWIEEILIDIYLYLTFDNYNLINDFQDLKKYAFENKNEFLTILIVYGDDTKVNKLLQNIHSEKNLMIWWSLILSIFNARYSFNLSVQLMNLIEKSNVLNELYEKMEAENTAIEATDNKTQELEIDYLLFNQDRAAIKIALILAKNGYVSNEKIELLKKTSKKMVEFKDNNFRFGTDETFKMFLQRDKSLYDWFIDWCD